MTVEMPIELRSRKVGSEEEQPLALRRKKTGSHERLRLAVDLSLWSESQFYAGLSGDPSQAGLFVSTYLPLRPGDSVLLRIELFGTRLVVEGIVRWVRAASEHAPPGLGVALGDLAPDAKQLIEAFCARRPPIYYELEGDDHH